jgi:hypothetical protein
MKSSSVAHPPKNKLVILREWQLAFCQGNHCAAILLSYLEYFHEWKLLTDKNNKATNDIAEMHGDDRIYSEFVYQYHTLEEFADNILNLFARNAIIEAIKLLESMGAISIHKNPNPKYKFDKKKYYLFHPEVCNEWIRKNYTINGKKIDQTENESSIFENKPRSSENKPSTFENKRDAFEKGRAITELTNIEINKQIKDDNHFFDEKPKTEKSDFLNNEQDKYHGAKQVIDALIDEGFPKARLAYPDSIQNVKAVLDAGADISLIVDVYHDICGIKESETFALNYLLKVVQSRLDRQSKSKKFTEKIYLLPKNTEPKYEPDYTNGLDWMGDLI